MQEAPWTQAVGSSVTVSGRKPATLAGNVKGGWMYLHLGACRTIPARLGPVCKAGVGGSRLVRLWAWPERPELTDAQRAIVEPLLPPEQPPTGRPNNDHRQVVKANVWLARTGSPWRDLPGQYGSWKTVASRFYCRR